MTIIRKPQPDGPVKARLTALIKTVFSESSFDPTIKSIATKMITNFLKNASEEALIEKISELRDEIIPFVLEGKVSGENAEPIQENTNQDG